MQEVFRKKVYFIFCTWHAGFGLTTQVIFQIQYEFDTKNKMSFDLIELFPKKQCT